MDVGTGSGILAILSLMYGAKHAVGTDLDPCAVDAVADNMANNGIAPEQFEMMIGNIINDKAVQDQVGYEKYDIVVDKYFSGRSGSADPRDCKSAERRRHLHHIRYHR